MNKAIKAKHSFCYKDNLEDEWQLAYNYARGYLLGCKLKGKGKNLINMCIAHIDDSIRDIVKEDLKNGQKCINL